MFLSSSCNHLNTAMDFQFSRGVEVPTTIEIGVEVKGVLLTVVNEQYKKRTTFCIDLPDQNGTCGDGGPHPSYGPSASFYLPCKGRTRIGGRSLQGSHHMLGGVGSHC